MTENNAEAPGARPRFLTLQGVAEVLNVSKPQAYALVRSGCPTCVPPERISAALGN